MLLAFPNAMNSQLGTGADKGVMALTPRATHVLQWPVQRVATLRSEANL